MLLLSTDYKVPNQSLHAFNGLLLTYDEEWQEEVKRSSDLDDVEGLDVLDLALIIS